MSGVFVTVMSIAKKSMGVLEVLDRAEGLRRMSTSAGCLVGKVGRRLPVSQETTVVFGKSCPHRFGRMCELTDASEASTLKTTRKTRRRNLLSASYL
jgi:hypothetical protein